MSGDSERQATAHTRLTVERLGQEGDGFAGPTRIAGALPGEVWEGQLEGNRIAGARLVSPSPSRVAPPCPHAGTCGGCTLQHAAQPFLATWKAEVIARALAAHGLEPEIHPTLTSPARSRRRAVLTGRRTKKTVQIGFHGHRSDTLVPIRECHVLCPEIMAAFPALGEITRLAASRAKPIRLAVTAGPGGLDLDLRDAKPLDAVLRSDLAAAARAAGFARVSVDGETVVLEHPPFQRMGAARVTPPPGAFLQATAEGEAALLAAAETITDGAERILDLFAGCGTFTLPLASRAEVHAVEGEGAMLAALDAGWRGAERLHRVTTEARDLFRRPLLAAELDRYEAILVDPPRAGAEAQSREIARSRVERIAFISCNPASFARDAAILSGAGFRLAWVQPVDQFLWTGHVELAARFER